MGATKNASKQQKQSLALVKTCTQRVTAIKPVLAALAELLRNEAADPGASLLAEYVASRSGVKLRSSLFLKKANPVWHARHGQNPKSTPLVLDDAREITFCHG